mmetsp:Transcript_6215/g.9001  ORF Transcript_6215/g.9001 Transcript_6215/m.9001 type:complete len:154 (-) Transcript_6215:145-606(-)|eukprot:CAMPEP_0195526556 /NCGR_PEP_ID=MMETSP0794_2-20130614/27697_1 /TAXON_ID=515487 /ORGANISM="Stephanopyxis turris, Strain CCMP 815" /LENGTH=153 /DNA_ID=CAMNT_0040657275 /DNA_START=60 /DNA_END=521 /DNA_ORIENTATION=-
MADSLDFALRVVESVAFSLHSILGITEPCTGCLRRSFKDNGAMPEWFWPVAGFLLGVVAFANFSGNDKVVLGAQAYIATFHMGAVFYHLRLGHHPAVGLAPGVFVLFAIIVTALRVNLLVALLENVVCAGAAAFLCWILVTPPLKEEESHFLI